MNSQVIRTIVDRHLDKWVHLALNKLPVQIAPQMAAPDQDTEEEWRIWLPIDSTVSEDDLVGLEEKVGHPLPAHYKDFLQHKHFYELHIAEISFCSHPVDEWQSCLEKMIFSGWPKAFHLDKGYIPFAEWGDYALLCFDTTRDPGDHNYPIVCLQYEDPDWVEKISKDFLSLLVQADANDRLRQD